MNLIEQSDSLPEGYGFWCISIDENFIYIGEKSIAVDDEYLFHSCLNPNYPALIYNKQLLLMEQLPSQQGVNIFDKQNLSLIKLIGIELGASIYSDDNYLYTAHNTGYVYVYEKNNFTVIETLFHEGESYANTVTTDSLYIYVGREAFHINVYKKDSFEYIADLNTAGYTSEFRTISTFDSYIYAGTSYNPKIFIYKYEVPPNISAIDGPTQGYCGGEYEYNFVATDPENQDVWYYVKWGGGDFEKWIGPYSSGQEITLSHTWDEEDTYTIRAKAKDIFGAESDWGTLEVTMPVNQPVQYPLLELFRERFPLLYQLLMKMLEVNPF